MSEKLEKTIEELKREVSDFKRKEQSLDDQIWKLRGENQKIQKDLEIEQTKTLIYKENFNLILKTLANVKTIDYNEISKFFRYD